MNIKTMLSCFLLLLAGCMPGEVNFPGGNEIDKDFLKKAELLLFQKADSLLIQPLHTVTSRPEMEQVTDSKAYVSLACYWWPDPRSDDGLPYIRRDGKVNPETRSEKSDLPKLISAAQMIETLTAAFRVSGDEQYAQKAIEQIDAWYINPVSSMHPHLQHAQMVKGRNHGRSYGVIDTWWMVRIAESIEHLERSEYWTEEINHGVRQWFGDYLNWLLNSEFGRKEIKSKNNHGTWFDVQVVTFAKLTGKKELSAEYLTDVSGKRIARQLTYRGHQKYEMRRTRPEHYSIYNLYGLLKLADLGNEVDFEHAQHTNPFSGDLETAVSYLTEIIGFTDPAGFIDPYDRTETDKLFLKTLLKSAQLFNNSYFQTAYKHHKQILLNYPELLPCFTDYFSGC